MQVILCPYFGAVTSIVWFSAMAGLPHRFAFGCADGSIHIYICDDTTVCYVNLWMFIKKLIIIQSQYVYLTQDDVHEGPILDLKFDPYFSQLASVSSHTGQSHPQVVGIKASNGGK